MMNSQDIKYFVFNYQPNFKRRTSFDAIYGGTKTDSPLTVTSHIYMLMKTSNYQFLLKNKSFQQIKNSNKFGLDLFFLNLISD